MGKNFFWKKMDPQLNTLNPWHKTLDPRRLDHKLDSTAGGVLYKF